MFNVQFSMFNSQCLYCKADKFIQIPHPDKSGFGMTNCRREDNNDFGLKPEIVSDTPTINVIPNEVKRSEESPKN